MPISARSGPWWWPPALLSLLTLVACGGAMYARSPGAPSESAAPPGAEKASDDASGGKPGGSVTTWKRSTQRSGASRLMVGDHEQLPLKGAEISARVDGFRARVTLDLYYLNTGSRAYEGRFQVRLPDEASPYYFAFGALNTQVAQVATDAVPLFTPEQARTLGTTPADIVSARAGSWSSPREAVMMPRERAAFAYAETVRRRVDPALLEWQGGGVFSAKVFPLEASKMHRVVIGYDVDLVRAGDDLELAIDLPEEVPRLSVDLNVAAGKHPPTLSPAATPGTAGDRLFYRLDNPTEKTVTLRFKSPPATALAGTDPSAGPVFATAITPDLVVPVAGPKEAPKAAPQAAPVAGAERAVLAVDVSLSANPDRYNVWLTMLEAVLTNNRPHLDEFAVVFFNVEQFWWRPSWAKNTPENVAELMSFARSLALEGATDLGGVLTAAARPPWEAPGPTPSRWDIFLLSDGTATWGESDAAAIGATLRPSTSGSHALFTYQTGMGGTDGSMLARLARESGGAVFSVVGEAEVARASTAHRNRPLLLKGVSVKGATDLMVAGRPTAVFPGQTLRLVGRGQIADGAEVVLSVEQNGQTREVRTKIGRVVASELTSRAFGQVAVNQLEELQYAAEKVATSYAMHFRVPGRTCSLVMLDSPSDYARYSPPSDPGKDVAASLASDVVAATSRQVEAMLADPKQRFLGWLSRLPSMPGVSLSLPPRLQSYLAQMPQPSFAVAAAPLEVRSHGSRDVPEPVASQLRNHQLDYTALADDAARRRTSLGSGDALKALSSLVEESPGDAVLARDVSFSAMEYGLPAQAYFLLRRVADARPDEPLTYRALAQCLGQMGRADLAIAYYEIALAGQWPGRFGEFRKIVALDYVRLLRRVERGELTVSDPGFARERLAAVAPMIGVGQADIVVSIMWNTDNTDVDLHVVEPSGEECYYGHRDTASGGSLTTDVTTGYGPEMYVLPRAPRGVYRVSAHYYASDRNRASARSKVYATVIEGFGTP